MDSKALYKILKLKPNGEWQQGMARTVEMLAKMEVKHEILDTYLRLRYCQYCVVKKLSLPMQSLLINFDISKCVSM